MEQEANPCCIELKKRYLKLEEKRNALRQAVKLLEHQVDKIQAENLQLKQAFEQECSRVGLEKEDKEKKSSLRQKLEKEVEDLKAELSSLQKDRCLRSQSETVIQQLEARIVEGEMEIKRLKELLDKEKKRAELEKRKADAEKKKASEASNLIKTEKNKVDDEKNRGEIERKRAEEFRKLLEKSKTETNDVREELNAERTKANDAIRKAEAERRKAIREKKHADILQGKVEELVMIVEDEKKKALEEKSHADHLHQQLLAETQKQKHSMKECSIGGNKECACHKKYTSSSSQNAEDADGRLLKEKLKLEKKQAKHARRVAKLQEAEKNLLQRELHFLKQDFLQFSWRLNMLDAHFSSKVEGIDGLTKLIRSSKPGSLDLKGQVWNGSTCDYNFQNENKKLGAFNHSCDAEKVCSGPSVPELGVNYHPPASGVNSDMESPTGDSVRKKIKSSVTCSTTSFSERQFTGSPERGHFAAGTRREPVGKNTRHKTLPNDCNEVTDIRQDQASGRLAEENDGNYIGRNAIDLCSNMMPYDAMKPEDSGSSRKKRKLEEALDSLTWLHSEDKKLHSRIEQKLCTLNDLAFEKESPRILTPSRKQSELLGNQRDPICGNAMELQKKTDSKKEKSSLKVIHCGQKDNQLDELGAIRSVQIGKVSENRMTESKSVGTDNICLDKSIDSHGNVEELVALHCFEDMVNGNIMKLLEFDNNADEERYRGAVAAPLSPTLPILDPPRSKLSKEADSHNLAEDVFSDTLEYKGQHLQPSDSFDIVDFEISLNKQNLASSNIPNGSNFSEIIDGCGELRSYDVGIVSKNCNEQCPHDAGQVTSPCKENDLFSAVKTSQGSLCSILNLSEVSAALEESDISTAYAHQHQTTPVCIVFCNVKDEDRTSRIICATHALVSKAFSVVLTEVSLGNILYAVALDINLQFEEKVCVLFSVLLSRFSGEVSSYPEPSFNEKSCSESFKAELLAVISDAEAGKIFLEMCKRENLISLIEDFFLHREILRCDLIQNGKSLVGTVYHSSGGDFCVSSQYTTFNELLAGGMILACLCSVLDSVDFVWELSCNILLSCRNNCSWILAVLHVFASICGLEHLSMDENILYSKVIKSVVLLLERGEESRSSTSMQLSSPTGNISKFLPCKNCPFAQYSTSMDDLIQILLGELEDCLKSESRDHCSESRNPSSHRASMGLTATTKKNGSVGRCSDWFADEAFCCFMDVISLLELIGCHMNWQWTCDKILPHLLKMLESCPTEEYLATLLVLVGRLISIWPGIIAGECEWTGAEEVRSRLSMFLDLNSTKTSTLHVQFAAVGAMVELLPSKFEEIVGTCQDHTVDRVPCNHTKNIQNWFSRLSNDQKSLILEIFRCANVSNT